MSTVAEFWSRTVASAAEAARLYFEPLSMLNNLVGRATGGESRPFHRFRPLAFAPTSHWKRDLLYLRRRVAQAKDPVIRRSEARAAFAWSQDAIRAVERLKKASEADYEDLMNRWDANVEGPELAVRPLYYQTLISGWFSGAAWLLTAVEFVLVALFLSVSLRFELAIAFGIGTLVTVILVMSATATLSTLILVVFESRPTRARQVLLSQIAIIGFLIFALVGGLLFARVSDAVSAKLSEYFLVALVTMTPVFIALLQAGAKLFGWSSELSRNQQSLEELRIEIDTLAFSLREMLTDEPRDMSTSGPSRRLRKLNRPDDEIVR